MIPLSAKNFMMVFQENDGTLFCAPIEDLTLETSFRGLTRFEGFLGNIHRIENKLTKFDLDETEIEELFENV